MNEYCHDWSTSAAAPTSSHSSPTPRIIFAAPEWLASVCALGGRALDHGSAALGASGCARVVYGGKDRGSRDLWRVEIPIVLFGRDYWKQVLNAQFLADEGVIADEHLKLMQYADTPEEAWQIIASFHGQPVEDSVPPDELEKYQA